MTSSNTLECVVSPNGTATTTTFKSGGILMIVDDIESQIGKMSEHLDFIQGDNSGKKTKYFEVRSRFDSCDLGRIKWHSHWRQYIFEPCLDTIWSFDCLEDLSLFLKNLNLEHKQEVKARKNANDDGIPPNNKLFGILPNEL